MIRRTHVRWLSAIRPRSKSGDSPVGSLHSRAAARATLGTQTKKDCICFPPDEPPRNRGEFYCGLAGTRVNN